MVRQKRENSRKIATRRTERLIKVFGVKRVGNHAVINWVAGQGGDLSFHWPGHQVIGAKLNANDKQKYKRRLAKNGNVCNTVIFNYEAINLKRVNGLTFLPEQKRLFGSVDRLFNIIIVRDIFNCLASYMYRSKIPMSLSKGKDRITSWKRHALEYSGETDVLGKDAEKIPICFNRWTADLQYRQQIIESMGMVFTDANFDNVSRVGGGSSFDRCAYNGRARKMKVHSRWKQSLRRRGSKFKKRYREILHIDPDVIAISNEICGVIDGTGIL